MNTDALYQEVILEHNRKPRNFRVIEGADRVVEGKNPSCGDRLTLWLKLDGDTVSDASFQGEGCAISRASASMMTAAVKGKSVAEAESLFERVHAMLLGRAAEADVQSLGSLRALAGVSKFPQRVKCASMAWHALHDALGAES